MLIQKFGRTLAALALSALALPAAAQSIHQNERTSNYTSVRGWTVVAVNDGYSNFQGCRAFKWDNGSYLGLEVYDSRWQLITPTYQQGRWGGGLMSVDRYDFDSQFGFENGFAIKELTFDQLDYVMSGNQLSVWVNGDQQLWYSLSGSTAAVGKIKECYNNGGHAQQTQRQYQQPQHQQPQQQHQFGWQQHNQPIDSRVANCYGVVWPDYRCTISLFNPDPGYKEAYRIDAPFGDAPSFFFQTINNDQADAWVSFDGGPWLFVGLWGPSAHDNACSGPLPGQNAEARRNLGQDAWDLCVR